MALLLRVVNEGEHMPVNQVVEEVNPSVEVGFEIGGATLEPGFSVNEGKPQIKVGRKTRSSLARLTRGELGSA